MLSMTHITLVFVVFGSLTHGSYSCYSDNIRRITKETCLRLNDHIYKRNTDFLDFGYKIKFEKANDNHDSYVKLTHNDFRGGFLKVDSPQAEQIFSNNMNEVNNYEFMENEELSGDMHSKNQYTIRTKRENNKKYNISYCCQRPKSPPCEVYSCHS